ncbi:lipopolysaccharide biosynthesis protein [Marinobacter panjinensis]|uniref:Lipopolysaccharide biosynthesis protein n=1 Tax=Marinobacter panjinensis TaxID=2576384 RepID=A0A4U6R5R3_9GAMM|nr:Wzz/FepE/Etk N-terminal domain-containing protein [Marinobacter panjinensis]MCR8913704.1 Wzz/FepE/Etk N-terminal domain-containing protein [Marinobacter panjinensis]TKV67646.1 lipopolysaccharide biosynthesis protein [Marinobacter panjinensis]
MVESSQGLRSQYDDEISLVDLATTFLKRRRVFYAVFLLVTLAGVAYALLTPAKYEYVTLVKLAEKSGGKYIEEPATVIAELDSLWVPDLQATYRAQHDRNLPFRITASNPENTGLVRIVSEANPAGEELIEKTHRQLIERLITDQEQALTRLRKSLERQIESLDTTIDMLEGGQETGDAIASAVEKQLSLETDLESLAPAEALVVSRSNGENTGPSRSLIVVLAAMLGLMGGVFLAFFAEFIGLVREKASEQ